jgi:plastocyanin
VQIAAQNIEFSTAELTVTADEPFQVVFTNSDASIPHDFDIHEGDPAGAKILDSPTFPGIETRTIDAEALPAGIYAFLCSVHPDMVGTLTAE